jgi:hypothetical protein
MKTNCKSRILTALLLATCYFFSCSHPKKPSPLKEGKWRGILTIVDSTGLILPFNFDLSFQNDSTKITIHNAEEKILVNEVSSNYSPPYPKIILNKQ